MVTLRDQKTPVWETVKLLLRLALFYSPLLLSVIADWEAQGVWFALSTVVTGLDKWKFEASNDRRGLVSF